MEELAIAERRILRKILGPIKEGDQYRSRHNNYINILRKLQTLLDKEELLFTYICKEWILTDSQEEF